MISSYQLIRPLLFSQDAEASHNQVMNGLARVSRCPKALKMTQTAMGNKVPDRPTRVMGLTFRNPVGLAAGLDKDAVAAPALAALGFGFIELGTVTPQSQPGNPKPRMFRLTRDRAIINRMGFNSCGIEKFVENINALPKADCIYGINLGKNAATPIEAALDDYRKGMQASYAHADYLTINISSPNTKDLRQLQEPGGLAPLLNGIRDAAEALTDRHQKRVPIALKVAPDLDQRAIDVIADLCIQHNMDAIIATNTTISRPRNLDTRFRDETGGLSGAPVTEMSTRVIAELRRALGKSFPIIGVGGIMEPADALEKFNAGANLVQLYTGFIYRGPRLVRDVVKSLPAS